MIRVNVKARASHTSCRGWCWPRNKEVKKEVQVEVVEVCSICYCKCFFTKTFGTVFCIPILTDPRIFPLLAILGADSAISLV
jgi:hypothetical protein